MTLEQINTKISQKMGWYQGVGGTWIRQGCPKNTWGISEYDLPDYYNDLNEVSGVVKTLTDEEWAKYIWEIENLCVSPEFDGNTRRKITEATSSQRCEALLKMWGLWEEDV